jgi:peptidoglycan hydrolase CwlO-like protein
VRLPARRLLVIVIAAGALAAAAVPGAWSQDLAGQRALADRLRSDVAAESARIAATNAGLADAERRLGVLVARVQERQAQLDDTQNRLIRARIRLTRLERREARAQRALSVNLVAAYKAGQPDLVTVVLNSNGFADLIERVAFFKRVSERNAAILDATRTARAAVVHEAADLVDLRGRFSVLAKAAIQDRDQADVLRAALLTRHATQLAQLGGATARLATVRARITTLERRRAAAARAAQAAATATSAAPSAPASAPTAPSGGGGGNADALVARVVAAASQIASTPYVWGGGHGSASGGYDCSGSLSYALAAAGLVSSPLDSTGFMSWGDPGPGSRITVYANAGHAFMIVDGRRFDTSALSGGGTRWTSAGRSTAGFVARHPPGL